MFRFQPSFKMKVCAGGEVLPNSVGRNRLVLSYRSCLVTCVMAFGSLCASSQAMADSGSSPAAPYRLHFFHTHTGERLDIVYRHGNTYDPNALVAMSHYLRDHR